MKKLGKGVAFMFYPIGSTAASNSSAASIKMNTDGSAVLYTGSTDVGQGSTTILAQIAAEELGIEFDKVSVVASDTRLTPYDFGPGASRTTYMTGSAVKDAATQAKQILLEAAAETLKVSSAELAASRGYIYVQDSPERKLTMGEVAARLLKEKGRPIFGSASFNPATTTIDKETGQGKPFGTYVFATQIAEVEVDTETGAVRVLKITAVHDCGKAINPAMTRGQVAGGVVMGIGHALMEEIVLDEYGRVKNPQFTDYVLPTALDVPEIVTEIVERPEPTGPFGAKGIGEPAVLPTAPAIVNAIQDAIGVRLRELPVTPEKILKALKELTGKNQQTGAELQTSHS